MSYIWLLLSVLAQQSQPSHSHLSDLIHQLGSPSIEEREDATASLKASVISARPLLEQAQESSDVEIAGRAREILRCSLIRDSDIAKHIRDGGRYFGARMYPEAISEFRAADQGLRDIIEKPKDHQELQAKVRASLRVVGLHWRREEYRLHVDPEAKQLLPPLPKLP